MGVLDLDILRIREHRDGEGRQARTDSLDASFVAFDTKGCRVDDVILSVTVDRRPDQSPRDVLLSAAPGQLLSIRVRRGTDEFSVEHRAESFLDVFRASSSV